MQFKLTGKQDVYIEVARRYREYIELGVYREGEKLPSVREAAAELGVNPNTVARAYAALEEEGFIYTLPKKGAYVSSAERAREADDCKNILLSLKEKGIDKETLLHLIQEVYEND